MIGIGRSEASFPQPMTVHVAVTAAGEPSTSLHDGADSTL